MAPTGNTFKRKYIQKEIHSKRKNIQKHINLSPTNDNIDPILTHLIGPVYARLIQWTALEVCMVHLSLNSSQFLPGYERPVMPYNGNPPCCYDSTGHFLWNPTVCIAGLIVNGLICFPS